MEITIFCKVVDNFGDIGVAFRLAKNLKLYYPQENINLVVSDLQAFHNINSFVSCKKTFQCVDGLNIYDWNADDVCAEVFSENDGEKLEVMLECFQCGRPEWLENILFEKKLSRTVRIIMIDYLTAEDYAQDFHTLQSLTRSSKVQKVNFMPGFTNKTGGLIIGKDWEKLPLYNSFGDVLVFTYDFNFFPLIRAFAAATKNIILAQGAGKKSFLDAVKKYEDFEHDNHNPINFSELPFLNQNEWDEMMKKCSLLFIRGEESLSRACLSGIPFVWQAYRQSEDYHIVKMNALLKKMRPFFCDSDFSIIENLWKDFNFEEQNPPNDESIFKHCTDFINSSQRLANGFRDFSLSLRENGDFCHNLMTFIKNGKL